MIRTLHMSGTAEERGAVHGAAYADEIRGYAAHRVELVQGGTWSGTPLGRGSVLELARSMLPAHERYSPDLHAEMLAMASAAGISAEEAIVVGGFTDFIDTVRGIYGGAPYEDTCTAVIVPGPTSFDGTGLLGQTWDMHDTATEHIVMLDIRPDEGPAALVYSTVGCVGQMGMNEAGLAIGINNLTASEGIRGVTWPTVVRKALEQETLDAAVQCVLDAHLAGAHNFLLVDAAGRGVNVEAMPSAVHVTEVDADPFVHTNHTLAPSTTTLQADRPDQLMSSSRQRLARAKELVRDTPLDIKALMALTRDTQAICQVSAEPYHIESCGGVVMHPAGRAMWAVGGRPDLHDYESFTIGATR